LNERKNILVIGIGNEFRGDDAAGLIAAEILREKNINGVTIRTNNKDGSALLLLWEGYEDVILIDAVSAGQTPGTVHSIDMHNTEYEEKAFRTSGHAFSVFETVKLAGYINKVPSRLMLYGIEGTDFETGQSPTSAVLKGIEDVVELIAERVS